MTLNAAEAPAPVEEPAQAGSRYPDVPSGRPVEETVTGLTRIGDPLFTESLVVSNRQLQDINIELNKQNARKSAEIQRLEKELAALRSVVHEQEAKLAEKDSLASDSNKELEVTRDGSLVGDDVRKECEGRVDTKEMALNEEIQRLKDEVMSLKTKGPAEVKEENERLRMQVKELLDERQLVQEALGVTDGSGSLKEALEEFLEKRITCR